MGQAKKRGTFEERKAQAIAAGRVKGQGKPVEHSMFTKQLDWLAFKFLMANTRIAKYL